MKSALSSRHTVESLTETPVTTLRYSPLSERVAKGRSSAFAASNLLARSSSLGFDPGRLFGASDLPSRAIPT